MSSFLLTCVLTGRKAMLTDAATWQIGAVVEETQVRITVTSPVALPGAAFKLVLNPEQYVALADWLHEIGRMQCLTETYTTAAARQAVVSAPPAYDKTPYLAPAKPSVPAHLLNAMTGLIASRKNIVEALTMRIEVAKHTDERENAARSPSERKPYHVDYWTYQLDEFQRICNLAHVAMSRSPGDE